MFMGFNVCVMFVHGVFNVAQCFNALTILCNDVYVCIQWCFMCFGVRVLRMCNGCLMFLCIVKGI